MDGDEDMRDASSGDGDGEFEPAAEEADEGEGEGVMVMEVRWFEVDLEYEFDAPRWFDLAQEESPVDAAAAQLWFASAPSYPPSPLIAKMLAEDLGLRSLIGTVELDVVPCSKSSHEYSGGAEQRLHQSHVPNEGRRPQPHYGVSENAQKSGMQTTVKGAFSRGSTLMKPTASQLAKQNRRLEAKNAMQRKKSVGVKSERSTMGSTDCTHQAAKRQRLEIGHLNKVVGTNELELIHKTCGKNMINTSSDRATGLPKLKITIPREPELATKQRAERSRIQKQVPTNSKQLSEGDRPSMSTVQARPSSRKVVHPFPFRATDHQYVSAQHDGVGSNMSGCTTNHASHLQNVNKKPEDCRDDLFKFKARPLDKRILASKGDVGVFRSAKKSTTVPKEFNLSTSRRGKQTPLSELFNKLSLTSEARRGIDYQTGYVTTKDCKENMISNMQC